MPKGILLTPRMGNRLDGTLTKPSPLTDGEQWEPEGPISKERLRELTRALPSGYPGKAGAAKSKAPLAHSCASSPGELGQRPEKPTSPGKAPKP
eukprot:16448388-Heterocapsa_arctica.AAC.2